MTEEYFSYEYYEDLYYSDPDRIIGLFSDSELYTIRLVAAYLQAKGYTWFCYHGLEYYYNRLRNKEYHWHTISRNIRRLTYTYNLFIPRHTRTGRKGCFDPTRSFYLVVKLIQPRLASEGINPRGFKSHTPRPSEAGGRI